jgi:predicted deacylase
MSDETVLSSANYPPFKSISFTSTEPGVRALITGAVHGNEVCGTVAIRRVIEEIEAGRLRLKSGTVTFVPVTNTLAFQKQERHGDRNLNRRLQPTVAPLEFEDHVANWLCPLMQQHQVLLDLHSFRSEGVAFVMVGPENNQGEIEPFRYAKEEEALAKCLGVDRYLDGWLTTYANGVIRRKPQENEKNDTDSSHAFGVGTTEYMRSVGGYALTLECGQHLDPQAPEIAYRAILNSLDHLGILERTWQKYEQVRTSTMEGLSLYEVVDKHHMGDQFSRVWTSFDEVAQGALIGTRNDGTAVLAQRDGRIIFPDVNADVGEEWFYLACNNERIR